MAWRKNFMAVPGDGLVFHGQTFFRYFSFDFAFFIALVPTFPSLFSCPRLSFSRSYAGAATFFFSSQSTFLRYELHRLWSLMCFGFDHGAHFNDPNIELIFFTTLLGCSEFLVRCQLMFPFLA